VKLSAAPDKGETEHQAMTDQHDISQKFRCGRKVIRASCFLQLRGFHASFGDFSYGALQPVQVPAWVPAWTW
jgi:hypothetical protein